MGEGRAGKPWKVAGEKAVQRVYGCLCGERWGDLTVRSLTNSTTIIPLWLSARIVTGAFRRCVLCRTANWPWRPVARWKVFRWPVPTPPCVAICRFCSKHIHSGRRTEKNDMLKLVLDNNIIRLRLPESFRPHSSSWVNYVDIRRHAYESSSEHQH